MDSGQKATRKAARKAARLWGLGRQREPTSTRPLLTPEEFQEELVMLGLSGKKFSPGDYAEALERHLEVRISLCIFQDEDHPELTRALARSGKVAECCYSQEQQAAAILVPSSLPLLARTLALHHELGHLAAGDLTGGPSENSPEELPEDLPESPSGNSTPRLARKPPLGDEELRERETDLRAQYALLAGSLGADSPYVGKTYDIL